MGTHGWERFAHPVGTTEITERHTERVLGVLVCIAWFASLAFITSVASLPAVDAHTSDFALTHRTAPIDGLMAAVSLIGGGEIMTLVAAFAAVGLVLAGRWRSAVFITVAFVAAELLAPALRTGFMRAGPPGDYRPMLVLSRSIDVIWLGAALVAVVAAAPTRWRWTAVLAASLFVAIIGVDHLGLRILDTPDEFDSFPSGHLIRTSVVVASLALVLWHTRRRNALIVAGGALLVLTAISRVYLGAHYPTDVLAGIAVGVGVALLVSLVPGLDPLRSGAAPAPAEEGSPELART